MHIGQKHSPSTPVFSDISVFRTNALSFYSCFLRYIRLSDKCTLPLLLFSPIYLFIGQKHAPFTPVFSDISVYRTKARSLYSCFLRYIRLSDKSTLLLLLFSPIYPFFGQMHSPSTSVFADIFVYRTKAHFFYSCFLRYIRFSGKSMLLLLLFSPKYSFIRQKHSPFTFVFADIFF